jgi:hypothetical protein
VAEQDATRLLARRVSALRRPLVISATLVSLLVVPAGVSSATNTNADADTGTSASTDVDLDIVFDEHTEQVGDLIRVSDPAPLGPFAAESLTDDGSISVAQAAATIAEAFALHSRPEATRKVLLDFDGETVISGNWNSGESIDAAAYSRGSDQTDESFSATDLIAIERIWASVAEDFAAWDVDITTEDPGAEGLAKSGADDVEYGVRVVITPTYTWFSTSRYGGVAYLSTFDRFEDLPAWVFSGNLANGSAKSVAEAVSHEVGHTLGLSHDGITTTDGAGNTTTNGYYGGHGDWAPIMGVGYYRPITQWSSGEYPGATSTQDDLAIIDGYISRLASGGAAEPGSVGPNEPTSAHTMADGGDIAEHVLQIDTGPVTVSVQKADPAGNLLAELRIRDDSGELIASAEPSDPATWSLEITLPAGTSPGLYTVEVESIGWMPSGDLGFTSYGSMGDYVLDVDAPESSGTTDPPLPAADPPSPAADPRPTADSPTTPTPESAGDQLTAVTPRRLIDTRQSDAPGFGPLQAGQDTPIAIDGLPSDATAVVVNVTAVAPQGDGFLSLTPCQVTDDVRTSSLNFEASRNIANSVIVPVSAAGQVCLFSSVPTHVLLDLTGWIGASGELALEQLGSTRLVDTRDGTGISRRLSAGVRTPISLAGVLGSNTVDAVALNITAIRPANDGFLTIDDCSTDQEPTSSLNFAAGETRGNNGVFALDTDQQLCVTSSSATDMTIDVTGEFGTAAGLTFVPSTSPERVLDTRSTSQLSAGGTTMFGVDTAAGANSLQRSPMAASVNLTATRHDDGGYVTAWSCGARPSTSALNPSAGNATANGALVELSPTGDSCLFHATGGHLIVDLAGWWI